MSDTMLEAGWPAHLMEHAKAIAHTRTLADMEPGWYEGDAGGPAPQEAIDDAVDVIVRCARMRLPAPWAFPRPDDRCGVELDWAGASDVLCCLEWSGQGRWAVYVERLFGVPFLSTPRAVFAVWCQLHPKPPHRRLTAKSLEPLFKRWKGVLKMEDV